jgi:hypothetical protein
LPPIFVNNVFQQSEKWGKQTVGPQNKQVGVTQHKMAQIGTNQHNFCAVLVITTVFYVYATQNNTKGHNTAQNSRHKPTQTGTTWHIFSCRGTLFNICARGEAHMPPFPAG